MNTASEVATFLNDAREDAIRTFALVLAQHRATDILADLDVKVEAIRVTLAAAEAAMTEAQENVETTDAALKAANAASSGVAGALAEHQAALGRLTGARSKVRSARLELAAKAARQQALRNLPTPDPEVIVALLG